MLHCQIATASDLSLLRMSTSRPDETMAVYKPLEYAYDTPLCLELRARFKDVKTLSKVFKYAREATSELGNWCADHLWRFALAEEEAEKAKRRIERNFLRDQETHVVAELDAKLDRIREAKKVVDTWEFSAPSFENNSISPKVELLNKYLSLIFEKPSDTKCIVFVERRYTARLLKELLQRIGTKHLRVDMLIGSRYGDLGDSRYSFRQQVLTLMKFQKGEINCLVSPLWQSCRMNTYNKRLPHL